MSGQLLFAALVIGSVYAMIGLGLNLVYGTMRLLNIAHGDLMMLGAYASFWLLTIAGVSPLASLAIAALGGPRSVRRPTMACSGVRLRPLDLSKSSRLTRYCCSLAYRLSFRTWRRFFSPHRPVQFPISIKCIASANCR